MKKDGFELVHLHISHRISFHCSCIGFLLNWDLKVDFYGPFVSDLLDRLTKLGFLKSNNGIDLAYLGEYACFSTFYG